MTGARAASARLRRAAPALLVVSVAARLLWVFFLPNGRNFVDLRVYVDGSAALVRGGLYEFTYSALTPDFPLPFTYPPFAALVFFPLHYLPFGFVGVVWQLLTMAALYAIVRITFDLLLGERAAEPGWRHMAMVWTAVGLWTEPVRTTLDYGQVNVFLVLAVLVAARSSKWWWSGLLVGFVAGIKLTPAVAGLYFVARRRWAATAMSAVAFGATVALSYLVIGDQARQYFGHLLGDASRIGPVGSVWNQSLRGALSRIAGHDVGSGALWVGAVAVTAALAFVAWRSLAPDDRLGTLLVVSLFGLMASPISWSHHWVWVVPMLIWLVHGPYRQLAGTKLVTAYWAIDTLVGVPWILAFFQQDQWPISRPGVLAWLGAVDMVGVVLFFVWVSYAGRAVTAEPADQSPALAIDPVR
ncbi:mannosyltransferase [Skermania sp. ID1734]|uniref:mannosyltransferase n=1 Tax=Skermania sp. ID1734 TaxID=2597516 RepID=UPI00117CFF28|nr:mannosyltransferase [Skermania sp. ID1734]TSE01947.1 mannosyltransferase [Skermania sp. ID1734]